MLNKLSLMSCKHHTFARQYSGNALVKYVFTNLVIKRTQRVVEQVNVSVCINCSRQLILAFWPPLMLSPRSPICVSMPSSNDRMSGSSQHASITLSNLVSSNDDRTWCCLWRWPTWSKVPVRRTRLCLSSASTRWNFEFVHDCSKQRWLARPDASDNSHKVSDVSFERDVVDCVCCFVWNSRVASVDVFFDFVSPCCSELVA